MKELTFYSIVDNGKTIIINDGVSTIPSFAFSNNHEVEEIKIPDSVKSIGESAFESCSSLKNIKLPEDLETIEYKAFCNCKSLEEIRIPDSIKIIRPRVVEHRKSNWFTYQIKEKIIRPRVFEYCKSLKNVKLPENLEKIDKEAFASCTSLEEIKIPDSVKSIGESAFENCSSLKNIKLPENLEKIDKEAFASCTSLEKLEITDSIRNIERLSFMRCSNLKKITIKYNNYITLSNMLVNNRDWLKYIKDNHSIELEGPNLGTVQSMHIKRLLKNNIFSFKINNVRNEKVIDDEEQYDDDIELFLDKINKICENLPDGIKNKIKSMVSNLLSTYENTYEDLEPEFQGTKQQVNLEFGIDVESLKPKLISDLQIIIATLATIENTIKLLEELNDYNKLLEDGVDKFSEGTDTKDIINNIVYISGRLGDRSSKYLSELSEYIDEAIKSGSLEIENAFKKELELPGLDYVTNFKLNVSKLYDEVRFRYESVRVYMEILDSLKAKETSYQGGDDLTCRVGSVKYIIANKIDRKKIKEEAEEKLNEFIKKYTDIINNILNNETLLKTTNPREIKTDFLKEFGLIIENLNNYVENIEYETMKKNRLLDDLNEAKNIVEKSKMVDENSVSGDITKYVVEINNRWVKDSTIKKSERKKIKNKLLEKVNKSLAIMDKSREELISYIEEERKCFIDKWLDILPESDSELINSLKKSIEKSSEVYGEENLELYDWNNLALKIIFGHIAYADLYTMSFLKANNNHAAASLKKRHSRK